jgi:hypothetical protein
MTKKNQNLIDQYILLYREKELLDEKLAKLKEKLTAYSESVNQKVFTSGDYLLRISQKLKILFPKKNQKGRKEILALVKQFPEYQKTLSFDIVKLANLYQKKQISQELRKKLARFATQKKVFRFSLQKKTS